MEIKIFILAGIVGVASSITISPNGNSPERKMVTGGMMIDAQKGLNPMEQVENNVKDKTNYEKSTKGNLSQPKLSLNERYRRLIPYMTFYYANDLVSPSTEPYSSDNVEIQKVQIEENAVHMRNAKTVMNIHPNRQIPRYQGNRLTKYNVASANPTSSGIKAVSYPTYVHNQHSPSHNHNPLYLEQSFMNGHTFGRNSVKHKPTVPSSTILSQSQYFQGRKPQQNLFHGDSSGNVQYYVPDKEPPLKYKLVPYEQTSLVRIPQAPAQNFHFYDSPKNSIPVPVLTTTNNQLYSKTRPRAPPLSYDEVVVQPQSNHLHSYPVTETYYDRTPKPHSYESTPNLPAPESGFMPMLPTSQPPTAEHVSFVSSTTAASPPARIMQDIGLQGVQTVSTESSYPSSFAHPEYYDYGTRPAVAPVQHETKYSARDSATLSDILATLQKSKSIPQPITKDNVGSSIRTLLQVLNALKASALQYNEVEAPILSTPKPFVASPKVIVEVSEKPELPVPPPAKTGTAGLGGEDYLAPVHVPSQHLDDYRGSSQAFPLVIASEDDGGTPGRAGIDYPTLTTIPETSFDCKTQRYKGFFADPETKCQVWHYCDLNGGQASFLCPNGTIFSQAALTCDWWFNVQCDSTHQLYVLNERLYKYILPHSPKFPEDYSGPLVDKYLTLKFKEMEEQFRKNKKKTSSSDREDDEVEANSRMGTETSSTEVSEDDGANVAVSESSVVVESPGNSGNVQHLEE